MACIETEFFVFHSAGNLLWTPLIFQTSNDIIEQKDSLLRFNSRYRFNRCFDKRFAVSVIDKPMALDLVKMGLKCIKILQEIGKLFELLTQGKVADLLRFRP